MNIIKGDITTVDTGVLINGVNCQRVMGSGVAKAYFTKWPVVRDQYMIWTKNEMKLGKFDPVIIDYGKLYVANCWTQEFFGNDGKTYADYGAILASVTQAALFARDHGLEIKTPLVGAGLGGLEATQVIQVLDYIQLITEVKFTLYVID